MVSMQPGGLVLFNQTITPRFPVINIGRIGLQDVTFPASFSHPPAVN
jgi:hypothetical protein